MDKAEEFVHEFLVARGHSVVHEPDGNVPPDFLLDGRIAVEVRRLIQHDERQGRARGLEETAIPLMNAVRKLLKDFGPPNRGRSWFLAVRFQRPLRPIKKLIPELRRLLGEFREGTQEVGAEYDLGGGFTISVFSASSVLDQLYNVGITSDFDSGGWVVSELDRNLRIVVAAKSEKTQRFRHKYPEWWLVLTDHIGLGTYEHDREQFRAAIADLNHDWHKILLVDPTNPGLAFEILGSAA